MFDQLVRVLGSLTLLACASCCASAQTPALLGDKQIHAHFRDGSSQVIGQVSFKSGERGATAFQIEWDHSKFQDYFLSMREFKCLRGPDEIACLVPYPHAQPHSVTAHDVSWLEHNLMFMYKLPSEFGAKLWNGMYFQLAQEGSSLRGKPMSIDLNQIAAPPDTPGKPPFDASQRSDMDAAPRWLQGLVLQ